MITGAEWRNLVLPLVDHPDDWALVNRRGYRRDWQWIVAGVLAEGSSSRDHLYVWAWSMPLFVPVDHVTLSQSHRVVPGSVEIADTPALSQALSLALADVKREGDYLATWAESDGDSEVRAYARVLLGDSGAASALDASEALLRDDGRPWAVEGAQRVARVATALNTDGADAAVAILTTWRDSTAAALRLRDA